jgi:hypothetical protein
MKIKVIKISPHSTRYKQIEYLVDEGLFSATKEDQEKFACSMVLPEAEVYFKEGDILEVILKPAD